MTCCFGLLGFSGLYSPVSRPGFLGGPVLLQLHVAVWQVPQLRLATADIPGIGPQKRP